MSEPPQPASTRHRVVIVGGGFGGLPTARFLKKAPVDVTLVDRTNHHLFQPLLYQLATGILSEGEIAAPLRGVLRKHGNTRVELAKVTGFDLEGRVVHATRPGGDHLEYPYDSLVVAAGAETSYFGHDDWELHAPGMKTVEEAVNLRRRIFGAYEIAETEPDLDERRMWMTFVVVGGGPTGVEIAGQIAELARRTLHRDFRTIDPGETKVLLFDAGDEILASFGDSLSGKATKELERIGVEIRTKTRVNGIDATGVDIEGPNGPERVATRTVVWGAGVRASPLAQALAEAAGVECDRGGRIPIAPDCTLPGHPEVFAIGDMMSLNNFPGVAEVAMQQGLYAARTIKHRLEGKKPLGPFRYRDLGSMAAIGRGRALVSFKRIRLSGRLGFLGWLFIHLAFLTQGTNRFRAILSWSMSFIGSGRGERTITTHVFEKRDLFAPQEPREAVPPAAAP